jgi:NAD(P)-dependent dehydrogenase (short-subunit alcohol dehydrogenase family)
METQSDRNPTTALIVGASQGIGLEFVRQLLQSARADRVYATYRNPQSELLAIGDCSSAVPTNGHYRRSEDCHCRARH